MADEQTGWLIKAEMWPSAAVKARSVKVTALTKLRLLCQSGASLNRGYLDARARYDSDNRPPCWTESRLKRGTVSMWFRRDSAKETKRNK